MKALTKGQYEALGAILRLYNDINNDTAKLTVKHLTLSFATLFEASDPKFKRELFLEQCGIKEDI